MATFASKLQKYNIYKSTISIMKKHYTNDFEFNLLGEIAERNNIPTCTIYSLDIESLGIQAALEHTDAFVYDTKTPVEIAHIDAGPRSEREVIIGYVLIKDKPCFILSKPIHWFTLHFSKDYDDLIVWQPKKVVNLTDDENTGNGRGICFQGIVRQIHDLLSGGVGPEELWYTEGNK